MNGIIYYHSNTGITRTTAQELAQQLPAAQFDLYDIAGGNIPNPERYAVVGFASWTYFLGLPPFFQQFLCDLPPQAQKPAFVLSTFGMMAGQALLRMEKILSGKGFLLLGGHALHTRESYPPYIQKGWDNANAPSPEERARFQQFAAALNEQLAALAGGRMPVRGKIRVGLLERIIRPYSVEKARKELGRWRVDPQRCSGCGVCQQNCLYHAIRMDGVPHFNAQACCACWACYQHCPQQAITNT